MKKIFLMSLGIIASYTSMQGMDPDVTTITINGKQGKIPMGSIRRHAPGLAERIEARGNPTDPVTIPGYPDEKFTMYLKPLLCILKAAAEILQPDPSSEEGSYKELQRKMFANKLHAGHTLELMQLGHEKLQLDPNIISAFSLNIACSPEVKKF